MSQQVIQALITEEEESERHKMLVIHTLHKIERGLLLSALTHAESIDSRGRNLHGALHNRLPCLNHG